MAGEKVSRVWNERDRASELCQNFETEPVSFSAGRSIHAVRRREHKVNLELKPFQIEYLVDAHNYALRFSSLAGMVPRPVSLFDPTTAVKLRGTKADLTYEEFMSSTKIMIGNSVWRHKEARKLQSCPAYPTIVGGENPPSVSWTFVCLVRPPVASRIPSATSILFMSSNGAHSSASGDNTKLMIGLKV
jgi:hypothetical protein